LNDGRRGARYHREHIRKEAVMQRSTLVLANALGLVASACQADADLGAAPARQTIVDGTPVADGADPAVVMLALGCSGTLVSPKVVLTAKHCTEGSSLSGMASFFGNDPDGTGAWVEAVDYQNHPATDIAVIALASPGPAAPIPVSDRALTNDSIGKTARIVGFGQTGEYASDFGVKRAGETPIYDYDADVVYVGESGSKTCYGDSGGPYFTVYDGVEHVFGVTSFGTSVCESGLSGGMRVDPYRDWIMAFIQENDPATCDEDGQCATGCLEVDPDCPCASDGFCTDLCPDATADEDCAGCGQGDQCRDDCPALDVDCCAMDGTCNDACGAALDPDGVPDDDDPGGSDDDDPVDPTDPEGGRIIAGGCRAGAHTIGGAGGVALVALAILMLGALGARGGRGRQRPRQRWGRAKTPTTVTRAPHGAGSVSVAR
jgi:hypothetical protein